MNNSDIQGVLEQLAYEIKIDINSAKDQINKAARDGYLGDLFRTDYTVTGRGSFPVDMLRYANSWPKGEKDASQIERSHEHDVEPQDAFTIRLSKYHRDSTPNLSEERWESKFRWKVLSSTVETVRL